MTDAPAPGEGKVRRNAERNASASHRVHSARSRMRIVQINNSVANKRRKFANNAISTRKYSFISFIPKVLFEQFRRFANFYFLLVAVLSLIPSISPTNPASETLPLAFVLSVSAFKELVEDFYRLMADRKSNNAKYSVVCEDPNKLLKSIPSKKIKCGDILKINRGQSFPADLVLCSTSTADDSCYVETSNLDGETNLKIRKVPTRISKSISARIAKSAREENELVPDSDDDDDFSETSSSSSADDSSSSDDTTIGSKLPKTQSGFGLQKRTTDSQAVKVDPLPTLQVLVGELDIEPPSPDMYRFEGRMMIATSPDAKHSDAPNARYTKKYRWLENSGCFLLPPSFVSSSLSSEHLALRGSRLMNTSWAYGVVAYTGNATKIMKNQQPSPLKFSRVEKKLNSAVLMIFGLYSICVTITGIGGGFWQHFKGQNGTYLQYRESSFIVGLESFMTYFIMLSYMIPISLYVSVEVVRVLQARTIEWDDHMVDSEGTRAKVLSSNLNEELGQVKYLFTDKTGTLTENVMSFKKCVCGTSSFESMEELEECMNPKGQEGDSSGSGSGSGSDASEGKWDDCDAFLRLLSLCHSVVPEVSSENENDSDPVVIRYQAESPDENALVEGAAQCRYIFTERKSEFMKLNVSGRKRGGRRREETHEVLALLEFTSSRKMMSVLCRDLSSGVITLYSKGADSVIRNKLAVPQDEIEAGKATAYLTVAEKSTNRFARDGLRVLWCATRIVDIDEWNEWKVEYEAALEAVNPPGGREALVASVCCKMEKDLTLVGCSALEDKLQSFVPQTIKYLMDANIHVWVLTGDKQETAINIAYACQLLTESMILLKLNAHSVECSKSLITQSLESLKRSPVVFNPGEGSFAMIIDGETLAIVLRYHAKIFLELALHCDAVLCCRVSPLQKALVVRLVKRGQHATTCAIGDGANDVSMIREAHVGLGISGREGTQAARASDYSIARFHHIRRLLCVHGRYSYVRLANLVQYSLYKNMAFALTMFYFAFHSGFSGQSLFDSWVRTMFNVLYTWLPPVSYAVLERDLPESLIKEHPIVYKRYHKSALLNIKTVSLWLCHALYHASVIYWVSYYMTTKGGVSWFPRGRDTDLHQFGCLIATCVVLVVNLKLVVISNLLSWINVCLIVLCILAYFVFIIFLSFVVPSFYFTAMHSFQCPTYWLTLLIVIMFCLVPDMILSYLRKELKPNLGELLLEQMKLCGPHKRFILPIWNEFQRKGNFENFDEVDEDNSNNESHNDGILSNNKNVGNSRDIDLQEGEATEIIHVDDSDSDSDDIEDERMEEEEQDTDDGVDDDVDKEMTEYFSSISSKSSSISSGDDRVDVDIADDASI